MLNWMLVIMLLLVASAATMLAEAIYYGFGSDMIQLGLLFCCIGLVVGTKKVIRMMKCAL